MNSEGHLHACILSHHSVSVSSLAVVYLDCMSAIQSIAGLELIDALEEGALMRLRREHMGRSSTGMGKNAHVRCVAEGFQARLFFDGQVCKFGVMHAVLVTVRVSKMGLVVTAH